MIPLGDLVEQYHSIKDEIDAAVLATLESGHFILGPTVLKFEESIASYLGVKHAIGLASGTDALVLALRALNIGSGDEVIIPAYTFFATAGTGISIRGKPGILLVGPPYFPHHRNKKKDAPPALAQTIITLQPVRPSTCRKPTAE